METEQKKNITVLELGIVCYLRCKGFKYSSIPQYIKGRVAFFFPAIQEVQSAIDDFNEGRATVDPKLYRQIFLTVKRHSDTAIKEALNELSIYRVRRDSNE